MASINVCGEEQSDIQKLPTWGFSTRREGRGARAEKKNCPSTRKNAKRVRSDDRIALFFQRLFQNFEENRITCSWLGETGISVP